MPERGRQATLQPDKADEANRPGELHEQIDVALFSRMPLHHRAEDVEGRDAVLAQQLSLPNKTPPDGFERHTDSVAETVVKVTACRHVPHEAVQT